MKINIFILLFLFLNQCTHVAEIYEAKPLETKKKKVVIFYNRSGGGHVAAAQVIRESLGSDDYDFININFSDTYLDRNSFFPWISNGKLGSDFWYNYTLSRGSISLSNFFAKNLVPGIIERKRQTITKSLTHDFKTLKPDLVISTIPLVNGFVGDVVKEMKIPFIVTTQDGDLRYFTPGLKDYNYENFFITVGINGDFVKKQLIEAGLPSQQIYKLHHPVRTSFLESYNPRLERKALEIPEKAFTLMILLGASGSTKIVSYAKTLLRKHPDIYIIACVGRSEILKEKLHKLYMADRLRVIGFTNDIPQIMTASDMLLTKPGPNSIIESIYMDLPMLVDHSSEILSHEQANLDFVVRNKYGQEFKSMSELISLVGKYKTRDEEYKTFKKELKNYDKGDYRVAFKKHVEKLLSKTH